MLKKIFAALTLMMATVAAVAQPACEIVKYDDLRKRVWNVSYILQDNKGFMWFSTTNGLYRFDGYGFRCFKSKVGDGLQMTSDKIEHMYQDKRGGMWCLIDYRAFLFDAENCEWLDVMAKLEQKNGCRYVIDKIRTLPNGLTWLIDMEGRCIVVDTADPLQSARIVLDEVKDTETNICADAQGNTWLFASNGTYLYREGKVEWRDFLCKDRALSKGRLWLVDADGHLCVVDSATMEIKRAEELPGVGALYAIGSLKCGGLMLLADGGNVYIKKEGMAPTMVEVPGRLERVYEDNGGFMWIQTDNHRLVRVAMDSGCMTEVDAAVRKDTYLHQDRYGTLWMLGRDGALQYIEKGTTEVKDCSTGGHNLVRGYIRIDNEGNMWMSNGMSVYKLTFRMRQYERLADEKITHTKAVLADSKGRYWQADRTRGTVKVHAADNSVIGYLGSDGRIRKEWTAFANVYCMYQDKRGVIWMGSKPDGLFRMVEQEEGVFKVDHFVEDAADKYSLSGNSIFHINQDSKGRIWLATLGGGVNCIERPYDDTLRFVNSRNVLARYDQSYNKKIYNICFTHGGVMLAASNEGLLVADAKIDNLAELDIKLHRREPDRKTSLSNSYVRNILEDSKHRVFVCTESGGVNQIVTDNLLADKLDFKHYCQHTGFPTDIAQSVVESDGSLWVVGRNMLVELNPDSEEGQRSNSYLETDELVFSEAVPVALPDGRWLFGLQYDGAIAVDLAKLRKSNFVPRIMLSAVKIQDRYWYGNSDTIVLGSDERDLAIDFAAIDYSNVENVDYAYRIGGGKEWNYIGSAHTLTFADMRPGEHRFTLHSTNAEGVWVDNHRTLTIIVTPTFWETPWAWVLYVLIIAGCAYAALRFRRYVMRIKRQRQDALDAYLKLIDQNEQEQKAYEEKRRELMEKNNHAHEDEMMKRVMEFIKDNIGNADVSIDDMASAVAVSRAVLNRKVKQITGMTPVELMKTARMQMACQMLKDEKGTVNEVAFACGFSDPKYFSKCFKSAMGVTPTDYRVKEEQ